LSESYTSVSLLLKPQPLTWLALANALAEEVHWTILLRVHQSSDVAQDHE